MNIENRNIRFTSTVICRIFLGIYLKICWWERIRFLRERRQGGKMSRKTVRSCLSRTRIHRKSALFFWAYTGRRPDSGQDEWCPEIM